MSATLEEQTLAALRRLEPLLAKIDAKLASHDTRLERIETTLPHLATKADLQRLDTLLPTLGTKADLSGVRQEIAKMGFDLTWRFLGLLGVILLGYLGAIWWVVTLTLRAHGVTG